MKPRTTLVAGLLSFLVVTAGCLGGADDPTTSVSSDEHAATSGVFNHEPCQHGGFGNHGGAGTNGAAGHHGTAGTDGSAGKLGHGGSDGIAGKLGSTGSGGMPGGGGAGGSSSCPTPPSAMVSWWHADGNFNDATGSNSGVNAGAVTFAAGEINQGFQLDGSANSHVTVANSSSLSMSSAITIDAWISSPTLDGRIVDKITAFAGDGYLLDMVGGQLRMMIGGDGIVSPAALVAGVLTHVAGVYDGTTMFLYVNGALVASRATAVTSIPVNSNALNIGCDSGGGSNFVGVIDEPRIFNRALSAAEIAAIFQSESAHCQ